MLNKNQFDAIVEMMGRGRISKPMKAALREFFCSDSVKLQKDIAKRHGVSPQGLNQRITMARKMKRLAYTLVTGDTP